LFLINRRNRDISPIIEGRSHEKIRKHFEKQTLGKIKLKDENDKNENI